MERPNLLDPNPDPVGRQALPQPHPPQVPQFETNRDPGDEDDPDEGKGSN